MTRFGTLTTAAALATLLVLPVLGTGCGPSSSGGGGEGASGSASEESSGGGSGGGISEEAKARAQEIFEGRCATCHGEKGEGDGPSSENLSPKPRDFTKSSWQESVSDEHIEKIIVGGGAAVGKSPSMPSNPDLTSKPEVVDALRRHIRSLEGQ